jgi:cytochrome c-type biogenesis protein CcmH
MSIFILLATLMLAIAVFFVIRPLLGKTRLSEINEKEVNLALYHEKLAELEAELANNSMDQAQFDATKTELAQQLLDDIPEQQDDQLKLASQKFTLLGILIFIPALAVGLYLYLGTPEALNPLRTASAPAPHGSGATTNAPNVAEMVAKLENKLKQNPDNARGWLMLARSYVHLKQFLKARKAYAEVIKRAPDHVQSLTDYADVIAVTQNGKLDGKPIELINRALVLEPNNAKALWLAGTYYFQSSNYKRAIQLWERLQLLLAPESQDAQMVNRIILEAKKRMSGTTPVTPSTPPAPKSDQQVSKKITVQVQLSDSLQNKVTASDTVFVFARAVSGPRMPLAIARIKVSDLPATVTLDDNSAMMAQMKISNFKEVMVSARVSKSGNAMPQKGDLTAEAQKVPLSKNNTVSLVIRKEIP